MKLFAVGNYEKYDFYAIIMAETKEDAINKLKNLKIGETIGVEDEVIIDTHCYNKNPGFGFSIDSLNLNKIHEIPSGIFIGENA